MSPTLSQVLAQGGQASTFGFFHLAAALAAVCIAAFSAVKGYEIYRRNRWLSTVVEDAPPLAERENKEEREKLNFLLDEMKREKERLAHQNVSLQGQLHGLEAQKQIEEVMRKSNVMLAKECEKLKAEKDVLTLKSVQSLIEIQVQPEIKESKPQTKKIKFTTKTNSRTKAAKKGGVRKPKRVSRKVK